MFFNSIDFLIFFGTVYLLYLSFSHKKQNYLLLAASYFFYGYWDYRFLSLLLVSTLVDYFCGIRIYNSQKKSKKKLYLLISIICNLGLLGFFKYFGFFMDSAASVLNTVGLQVNPWSLRIILPAGISFYTFQTMSYTIDIYRGQFKPTHNFWDFALFVSFFPQLVAGPIERARNLLPQISNPRELKVCQIHEGLYLITWGLFKKIIIADSCARIVNHIFENCDTLGWFDILIAINAFGFQLYGDFSGYSAIARGLAKLMGFELMMNFNSPLLTTNPPQLWTRWHISLTTWVRDYLYKSFGKLQRGLWRININILISMTIIGLWHGASWTFVLWGFYFGVIQVIYNLLRNPLKRIRPQTNVGKSIHHLSSILLNYHLFIIPLLLFRAENISHTSRLIKALFRATPNFSDSLRMALVTLILTAPCILVQIIQEKNKDQLFFFKWTGTRKFTAVTLFVFFILYAYFFGANVKGGEDFIYFQF